VKSSQRLAKTASYDSATGRALFALIAEQAQQAGWSAFDAGWQSEARALYELSREAAKEARSESLTGNALAFLIRRAHNVSAGVASARPGQRIAEVAATLIPFGTVPAVAETLRVVSPAV